MQPESTTYHYSVHRDDSWPLTEVKLHTKGLEYEPDTLSFDVHVTHETGKVTLRTFSISGFRVHKDGTKSTIRVHDARFTINWRLDAPSFAVPYLVAALDEHGGNSDSRGT